MQQPNQQFQSPQYNPNVEYQPQTGDYSYKDNVEQYGSIIKDLTDTDKLLEEFEYRLLGKKKEGDKIIDDPNAETYIKNPRAARTFIDIVKSQVNRHNDFSYYDASEIKYILDGANYTICRWLMFQGPEVPTKYRQKISFEAMGMINASLHKAVEGRMLRWSKGSFSEGRNITETPNKKGIWDYIFPWTKKH